MELEEIKTIVELMQQNNLALFEMEHEGFKIKLQRQQEESDSEAGSKGGNPNMAAMMQYPMQYPGMMHPSMFPGFSQNAPAQQPASTSNEAANTDANAAAAESKAKAAMREINSPMVGTFYQAASPENPAFVKVGQEVNDSTVVCIIEAMKVMNEIKAEAQGVIAEILVENGKPVQFGQPLFRLKDK